MLVGLSVGWYLRPLPIVTMNDVEKTVELNNWDKEKIQQYFKDHGLTVQISDKFDYQYLQHVEVVEFKGRRVAKLTLSRMDGDPAIANVLILPGKQFRMDEKLQKDMVIPHTTWIEIRHERHSVDELHPDSDFTYFIFYRGRLDRLEHQVGT